MSQIVLPLAEANLLRRQIRRLLKARKGLVEQQHSEAIHDLRVASRRLREVLDFLKASLPEASHEKLWRLTRRVTRMLGEVRELQVNLQILNKWQQEKKADPCALEYLIYKQRSLHEQARSRAFKKLGAQKFGRYEKFLARLKGSATMESTHSELLETRKGDILRFTWRERLTDLHLHNLRIQTKKLRYAWEINDTLTIKKLSPAVKKLKRLQDALGAAHDLAVIMSLVRREEQEWRRQGFHVIPSALGRVYRHARVERAQVLPNIRPRYDEVFGGQPVLRVQSAEATAAAGGTDLKQAG